MIVGFEVDGFHIIDELFWKRQARASARWTRVLPIVWTDSVPESRLVLIANDVTHGLFETSWQTMGGYVHP